MLAAPNESLHEGRSKRTTQFAANKTMCIWSKGRQGSTLRAASCQQHTAPPCAMLTLQHSGRQQRCLVQHSPTHALGAQHALQAGSFCCSVGAAQGARGNVEGCVPTKAGPPHVLNVQPQQILRARAAQWGQASLDATEELTPLLDCLQEASPVQRAGSMAPAAASLSAPCTSTKQVGWTGTCSLKLCPAAHLAAGILRPIADPVPLYPQVHPQQRPGPGGRLRSLRRLRRCLRHSRREEEPMGGELQVSHRPAHALTFSSQ